MKLNIITQHDSELNEQGNPRALTKEEQYYEGRPTVDLDGVTYEYHPHGIGAPQLLGNQDDHERQAESDANWLASCSPAALAEVEAVAYKDKRKAEYPSVGDQLDALWKARQGDTVDADAIAADIAAVKVKYPK